jgi:endo-1,4-beta-xylanase
VKNLIRPLQTWLKRLGRTQKRLLAGLGIALALGGGIGGGYAMLTGPSTPRVTESTGAATAHKTLLDDQWSYLPGSKREGGSGLRIMPYDFKIVQQDGSGGQPNYPVNEYGVHLEKATNFTVTAGLRDVQGKAAMALYGRLPIIADEFRVERGSIRAEIAGNTLNVRLWDGNQQQPVIAQSLPLLAANAAHTLTITHADGHIHVMVDGQQVTSVSDSGIFADGFVWLGFDATDKSFELDSLEAKGVGNATFKVADSATLHVTQVNDGLQALAAKKRANFNVGAAMALTPAVSDPAYAAAAFSGNFGILTTENALKWQFTEPVRGSYDFKEADALVQLAARHNIKVHGHTLVFGEANPAWVQNTPKDQLQTVMADHITKTMTHFKGKIYSWDVVNEPFDDTNWDQFRQNIWYKALGEGYIATAFRTAHQADPNALLFMNEYGIEEDGNRWNNFLALVTRLKKDGVPINGVGFQSHVYEAGDKINAVVLRKHIQQLAAIGVQSRVSEMDVYSEDGQGVQASQFSSILQACLAEPSCVSWTTWGVSDRYDYFIDDDGSIQQGNDFLWDENVRPTPAVKALQDVLR